MISHCAVRIGFVSYVYQQRDQIKLALGLIDEVPIAFCSHKYNPDTKLHIEVNEESDATAPVSFHVQEIQLFFTSFSDYQPNSSRQLVVSIDKSQVIERKYATPVLSVFHPPC